MRKKFLLCLVCICIQLSAIAANSYGISSAPIGDSSAEMGQTVLNIDCQIEELGLVLPETPEDGQLSQGSYCLTGDYEIAQSGLTIAEGESITIDLRGYRIYSSEGKGLITNSGSLTIKDSLATGEIVGCVINNSSTGELNLENVNINGGYGTEGGGIYNLGTLTMTGGSIHNCQAKNGGAISNKGSAQLQDVEIYDNTALGGNGGAIYVSGGTVSVEGGIIRDNQAQGSPEANITTAGNPDDNIGVGGGIYVFGSGKVMINSQCHTDQTGQVGINIYANRADFAADDIYCAPGGATVTLCQVSNINLVDSDHRFIGKVKGWFEDYPIGDSLRKTQSGEPRGTVEYSFISGENGTKEISGYRCLTVSYEYTRVSLMVTNQGAALPEEQVFYYTATIQGSLDGQEADCQTSQEGNVVPALIFAPEDGEYTVLKNGAYTDDAQVKFSLKAGESVEIKGIPVNSTVTIVETSSTADEENWALVKGNIGRATAGAGATEYYQTSFIWDDGTVTEGVRCENVDMGTEYRTVVVENELQ